MPSDNEFTEEKIQKMLEESRVKQVPPQVLKGFKDDVMRRIAAEAGSRPTAGPASGPGLGPKPGRWFAAGFRLPRIQMTVGAGAFACLILIAVAAVTTDHLPKETSQQAQIRLAVPAPVISDGTFQIASAAAPAQAVLPSSFKAAAASLRSSDMMKAETPAGVSSLSRAAALTVEEELRLIEEFDNKRFFIRQDITLDELASA